MACATRNGSDLSSPFTIKVSQHCWGCITGMPSEAMLGLLMLNGSPAEAMSSFPVIRTTRELDWGMWADWHREHWYPDPRTIRLPIESKVEEKKRRRPCRSSPLLSKLVYSDTFISQRVLFSFGAWCSLNPWYTAPSRSDSLWRIQSKRRDNTSEN